MAKKSGYPSLAKVNEVIDGLIGPAPEGKFKVTVSMDDLVTQTKCPVEIVERSLNDLRIRFTHNVIEVDRELFEISRTKSYWERYMPGVPAPGEATEKKRSRRRGIGAKAESQTS